LAEPGWAWRRILLRGTEDRTPQEEVHVLDSSREPPRAGLPPDCPYDYFHFQAQIGFTKPGGGSNATREMLTLCHVAEGQHILDVGCGAGITASYVAREYACRVTAIDIFHEMIIRARGQAERVGVTDETEFRVADALQRPYDDNTFDATVSESVTAFSADRARSLAEYARVTRPGGHVGLNEATFVEPPTPALIEFVRDEFGPVTEFLSANDWATLLGEAGLREVTVRVRGLERGTQ
jgi:cyclopropane fatty-acyl-phospholipid synthase-like methyltransferase